MAYSCLQGQFTIGIGAYSLHGDYPHHRFCVGSKALAWTSLFKGQCMGTSRSWSCQEPDFGVGVAPLNGCIVTNLGNKNMPFRISTCPKEFEGTVATQNSRIGWISELTLYSLLFSRLFSFSFLSPLSSVKIHDRKTHQIHTHFSNYTIKGSKLKWVEIKFFWKILKLVTLQSPSLVLPWKMSDSCPFSLWSAIYSFSNIHA